MKTEKDTDCPLIDDLKTAEAWFAALGHPKDLVFDLEADGLHRYEDKVCLAQVGTADQVAILDPLPDRAILAPLGRLLTDPGVRKILHGGDYDVRLLKKDYGYSVANLFDTMIAGQLLGRKQLGLAGLLETEFGVVLDKRFQKADWSKRPLEPGMLRYAALDVLHLPALCEKLEAELEGKGRTRWAQEEFTLLEKAEPPPPKKPWCLDVKGSQKLAPSDLMILQNLLEVRDAWARKWDRPAFKVLAPQLLLDWVSKPPASRRELIESSGGHRGTLAKLADELLEAISKARRTPSDLWPRRPESPPRSFPTEAEKQRLKKLKTAREAVAKALELEPGLLANGATLERIAALSPDAAPAEIDASLKNWQREVVADALKEAVRG